MCLNNFDGENYGLRAGAKIVSDSKEYVSQNLALSHIDDNELREKIDNIVNQRIGSLYCSLNQRASMVEQVYSSIRGLVCSIRLFLMIA